MGRAPCCDKANVRKGPWSPDEDATLKSYVETHGTAGSWIALPRKAGLKRCGKSCRLRWLNYLRPNIKHGDFTEEEDNVIFNLYNQYGSRWSTIASHLPGRTDNDVKNHWNTKLKKKLFLAGKTKLETESMESHLDSTSSLAHAPETESHAIGLTPSSLPLSTLTEFSGIINHRPISEFAGFNLANQFDIPTVSSSSFSKPSSVTMDRHASVPGAGRDEWGLMEDWGCDFPPDMVCSMLFKEKNGELCL